MWSFATIKLNCVICSYNRGEMTAFVCVAVTNLICCFCWNAGVCQIFAVLFCSRVPSIFYDAYLHIWRFIYQIEKSVWFVCVNWHVFLRPGKLKRFSLFCWMLCNYCWFSFKSIPRVEYLIAYGTNILDEICRLYYEMWIRCTS